MKANKLKEVKRMNVLKITSGAMRVSDPCVLYDESDEPIKVPNGDYIATLNYTSIKSFGENNKTEKELVFCTKANTSKLKSAKWESVGSVGVDSGLVGAFDGSVKMSEDACNEWYDEEVIDMDESVDTFLNGKGVVSITAFGDGSYNIAVAKEGGVVIAVKIEYVTDADIEYYNTPSMFVDQALLVFHSSNTKKYVACINMKYDAFVKLNGASGDILGGIVTYASTKSTPNASDVTTSPVKLNASIVSSLFKMPMNRQTITLEESGKFIMISAKEYNKKGNSLDAVIKGDRPYNLSNIQFDVPAGTYAVVKDELKGRVVGVSIRKIK